jgi:hypothetical protein
VYRRHTVGARKCFHYAQGFLVRGQAFAHMLLNFHGVWVYLFAAFAPRYRNKLPGTGWIITPFLKLHKVVIQCLNECPCGESHRHQNATMKGYMARSLTPSIAEGVPDIKAYLHCNCLQRHRWYRERHKRRQCHCTETSTYQAACAFGLLEWAFQRLLYITTLSFPAHTRVLTNWPLAKSW